MRLILRYKRLLNRYWNILLEDEDVRPVLGGERPQITFRKSPSLKYKLVRSHFVSEIK